MSDLLRVKFRIGTTRKRLYKAKKMALNVAKHDYMALYSILHDYASVILMRNRGVTMKIQQDIHGTKSHFKRFFINYDVLQRRFMVECRRFIGVDGCHIKNRFGKILLFVVGMDANNGIFPLAVCVCETKNKDSWYWFFRLLKEHMQITNRITMMIMSDRQKGLIATCAEIFPETQIRYCDRHVIANFQKLFSSEILREKF